MARLFIDMSSLARWSGPAVGMVRVEREVVRWAVDQKGAQPVVFDPDRRCFRSLREGWYARLSHWDDALDPAHGSLRGARRFLPRRYQIFLAMERRRLMSRSAGAAARWDRAQRLLYRFHPGALVFQNGRGERRAIVPVDLALGGTVAMGPDDRLISVSSDWDQKHSGGFHTLKRRAGFRLTVLCYDLIPLTHPQFFLDGVIDTFRKHWRSMLVSADTILVNSSCIAGDLERFSRTEGLPAPALRVVPLGCDRPPKPSGDGARLPAGLSDARYALFISTIEPRKGHALLLDAWQDLLHRGVPQRSGFRLVFVGRPGWMVEDVLRRLGDAGSLGGTVLHFPCLPDEALETLHAKAEFCLYPSAYEGFGLPVVEALARGKAVLASGAGAVPEAAAGLARLLPPDDPMAWAEAIAQWIENPAERRAQEAVVARGYRHRDWAEVAREMVAAGQSLD
ncbi:glycosyltransferase family 1 protein [Cyanobium gracile UHCC 0139]|uniref:Glycosyltransferase family 1 protein n=1 Tax=Cyanobium gracile UHCC 0139 TaxID=3110308 RepID=A0ABU5RRU0_9CYAN|nr:glycosyltransferase family 1 protein [Cyanobium gracile]MEA5390457.1 glycosyltransferase family 1 protein [Cyanobium gracile UHCC 0139]